MMRLITAVLTLLVMAGCVSMEAADTNEKKLAAAEITYKNTMSAIEKNVDRLTADQKSSVAVNLTKVNNAMKAARLALKVGNDLDFSNNLQSVNTSLDVLRAVLEELEKEETSNVSCIQCYYFA